MKAQLDRFETGFILLARFFAAMVAISIGLIAVLIPFNLFIVKAGIGSIWWLNEGIEYILYFGVFTGATWVLQQGAHVRVDVMTTALPEDAARKLDILVNIFGVALCILLCIYGIRAGWIEYLDQTLPDKDVRIPNWIVITVFAFSFAMLSIEFLLRMRKERVLTLEDDDPASDGGF